MEEWHLNKDTCDFIRQHRMDDVRQLALQGCRNPEVNLREALVQIAGWQQARIKLPQWTATEGLVYPPHLPMEQCSSQLTAEYKRNIIERVRRAEASNEMTEADVKTPQGTLTDITGGLGIDCSYLAPLFMQTTYVERQEQLCLLARHNFPLLGMKGVNVCHGDGVEHLKTMTPVDWIYLDPARRNAQGNKVVAIGDCEPNVQELEPLLLQKARHVLVKLSPMLDLTLALHDLKQVKAAFVVAADGECKELLLLLGQGESPSTEEVPITCTHLHSNRLTHPEAPSVPPQSLRPEELTFCKADERQAPLQLAHEPELFLYEPHAALLKAGAYNLLTQRYPVRKLHPNSHLYTSGEQLPDFPGRRFRITGWSGLGKKELKALLSDVESANLTVRNFPMATETLRKKLKLAEGGSVTLFATTLANHEKVLIRTEALVR